ncbi:Uncharacterised protein [Mycobacteroides abscessus subsp. abscessus]|nr:Uncharacterised protein [Mycobacteroides abscessus subsp. abscessus]
MEGDGGLARARSALDDEDALEGLADDRILLGLDGRDDVAHPPGPVCGEGGDERALALECRALGVIEGVEVEDVVLDIGDPAVLRHEVTAPHDALRVRRGRLVEGLRGGSAPVDEDLLAIGVGESDAPDVARFGRVLEVEASEAQSVLSAVEADELVLVQGGEGVALAAVLVVSPDLGDPDGPQTVGGLIAQLVESCVEFVELALFDADF